MKNLKLLSLIFSLFVFFSPTSVKAQQGNNSQDPMPVTYHYTITFNGAGQIDIQFPGSTSYTTLPVANPVTIAVEHDGPSILEANISATNVDIFVDGTLVCLAGSTATVIFLPDGTFYVL